MDLTPETSPYCSKNVLKLQTIPAHHPSLFKTLFNFTNNAYYITLFKTVFKKQ